MAVDLHWLASLDVCLLLSDLTRTPVRPRTAQAQRNEVMSKARFIDVSITRGRAIGGTPGSDTDR